MNMNSGYKGYSMSVRASQAYDQGEKPLSQFGRDDLDQVLEMLKSYGLVDNNIKVTVSQFKQWLKSYGRSSWHHTSSYCNDTDFYSSAYALTDGLCKELSEVEKDDIIISRVNSLIAEHKAEEKQEQKEIIKEQKVKCIYLEWSGSRKHPKATEKTEIGTLKGNWVYFDFGKKSISGNGFRILEYLD